MLNSHEYTHVDIIEALLRHRVELLVVINYNNATRLFWEYAAADLHRLFCFVIIVNVEEFGGSGVFAPFRRVGKERNAQLGTSGRMFTSRGAGNMQAKVALEIDELRRLRRAFSKRKTAEKLIKDQEDRTDYHPILPSQHFMRAPR